MENCGFLKLLLARRLDGFVLAFHEISPGHFSDLIDCLGPPRAVHLDELVQRTNQRKSNVGLFAITVDDGVGWNVAGLAKVMVAKGWPATFYLPTRYVETGEGMAFQYWRRLQPLLPRGVMSLRGGPLDLSDRHAVERLAKRMQRLWYTRPLEEYCPLTMELVECLLRSGVAPAALKPPRPITWAEVEKLGQGDLIRFESHAVTHTALAALSEEQMAFEMKRSRDEISEHTGRLCRHLAYPFGGRESIGAVAPVIARRYYDSAATLSAGRVDGSDPWLLPRIPLYAENSRLVARLKVILYGSSLRVPAGCEAGTPARRARLAEPSRYR